MGTKMAPVYTNLFMADLEERILIDDIFCVLPGTPGDVQNMLDILNSKHPTIKFTSESSTIKMDYWGVGLF